MKKIVSLGLSAKDIEEIIAQYFGVNPEKVTLGVDSSKTVFGYVEKELTFPVRQASVSFGTYNPLETKLVDLSAPQTTTVSTSTKAGGYLPGTFDSPTRTKDDGVTNATRG